MNAFGPIIGVHLIRLNILDESILYVYDKDGDTVLQKPSKKSKNTSKNKQKNKQKSQNKNKSKKKQAIDQILKGSKACVRFQWCAEREDCAVNGALIARFFETTIKNENIKFESESRGFARINVSITSKGAEVMFKASFDATVTVDGKILIVDANSNSNSNQKKSSIDGRLQRLVGILEFKKNSKVYNDPSKGEISLEEAKKILGIDEEKEKAKNRNDKTHDKDKDNDKNENVDTTDQEVMEPSRKKRRLSVSFSNRSATTGTTKPQNKTSNSKSGLSTIGTAQRWLWQILAQFWGTCANVQHKKPIFLLFTTLDDVQPALAVYSKGQTVQDTKIILINQETLFEIVNAAGDKVALDKLLPGIQVPEYQGIIDNSFLQQWVQICFLRLCLFFFYVCDCYMRSVLMFCFFCFF